MRAGMIAGCVGIGLVAWLPRLPPWWLLAAAGLLLLGCWRRRSQRRRWPIIALAALLGVAWGSGYGHRISDSLLPVDLELQPLYLHGRVIDLIETREAFGRPAQRFLFRVEHCFLDDESDCPVTLRTVQLTAYRQLDIHSGERWQVRAKLKRPHGLANPGGFDFESWQVQRNISAVGSLSGREHIRLEAAGYFSIHHWRARLRDHLQQRLAAYESGPLLMALLVADDAGITRAQWQLFRDTGTIHLFVVSGSHIAITGGLVWWLAQLWRRTPWSSGSRREHMVCALPALLVALVYALLAGMGLPIQRALIMFGTLLLATTLRRNTRFADVLLLALLLVLLHDPLAARDAGCWFSFAAVSALALAVSGTFGGGIDKPHWGWLRAQWLVFVACVPILMLIGGQLSLLSLPANIFAIPLTSLLTLPLAFIALLSEPIAPAIADGCWQAADFSLRVLLLYLQRLHEPFSSSVWPLVTNPLTLIFAALAVALLLLPRGVPGRSLALVFLLPLLWPRLTQVPEGSLRATVIDVGQGLSVLIQTREHRLLYDTGPAFGSGATAAEMSVLPLLRQFGVSSLDRLMVSHRDSDHAGGVEAVLTSLPTQSVWVGERLYVDPQNIKAPLDCQAGQHWRWNGVDFTVLSPDLPAADAPARARGNNRSCVLLIVAGDSALLLAGDIERDVEQYLLEQNRLRPLSLLVAPHHGSRSSSTPEFVYATQPELVVFSAGYRNAFGHPHPRVIERYTAVGSRLFNTAVSGALTVEMDPTGVVDVTEYRRERRHYWNWR